MKTVEDDYRKAVELFTTNAALTQALQAPLPKICRQAAQGANLLCRSLGVAPDMMGKLLLLPEQTDFRIAALAATLKAQPEALYRFAILRETAQSVARKCGNDDTARIWWHSTNGGVPFSGQPPMRYLLQGKPAALYAVNQTILAIP